MQTRPVAGPREKIVDLSFPYRGIDRSGRFSGRPAATTEHARNMWPAAAVAKRAGGGRRPVLTPLWTNTLSGDDGSQQINHLAVIPTGAAAGPSVGGAELSTVVEKFVGKLMAGAGVNSNLGQDWVVWRKDYASGAPHYVAAYLGARVQKADLSGVAGVALAEADFGGLSLSFTAGAAGGYPGVASSFNTTNVCTLTLRASGQAGNANGNVGAVGEPTNIGPCIRQSGNLSSFIVAVLTYTGIANQVRLDIVEVVDAVRTVLSSSIVYTLSGTAWNATTQGRDGPKITIEDAGGVIRATCFWAAEGLGVGGVQALTCSIATTSLQNNKRAGVAVHVPAGAHASVADRWCIKSVELTRLVLKPVTPIVRCDLMSDAYLPGVRRFFVPQNCTGCSLTTAGALTTLLDTQASDVQPANVPYLDYNQWRVVQGRPQVNRSQFIVLRDAASLVPQSNQQVEVRGRVDELAGIDTGAEEDIAGVALRLTNDLKSGILIEVQHGAGLANYLQSGRLDNFTHIRVVGIANGARFVLGTLEPGAGGGGPALPSHMPPFHAEHSIRFEDGGQAALAAMTVAIKVHGVTLLTLTPSTMAGWAAFSAALALVPGATTSMDAGGLKGLAFWSDAAAPLTKTYGGTLVDITPEGTTGQVVTEYASTAVAVLHGRVWYGSASGGVATLAPGRGPLGPLVHSTYLNGNLFMVDGDRSLVMPLGLSTGAVSPLGIAAWQVGNDPLTGLPLGEIPAGCALLASFLGRAVLARPKSDPTAMFLLRSGDPFDADYNADPVEGSAQAAANSVNGEPAEPIVGLIPFGADGMLVCGPERINLLIGEPTLGGRFVSLTRLCGLLQSKAWCYDHRGSLYFMSSTGLYRMLADGSAPENLDRNRLGPWMSEPDAESYFWQLGFDPKSKTVHVLRSHVNKGISCVHGMYHPDTDTFWENVFDGNGENSQLNPWAIATATGTNPIDRRLLMGGQDGVVRRFLDVADAVGGGGEFDAVPGGTAGITTEIDMFPEDVGGGIYETMAETLFADFWTGSGVEPASAMWFTAPSWQEVAAKNTGDQETAFQLQPGANAPVSIRRRALAHKMRLLQTNTAGGFAMERIAVSMSVRGRRR